MPATGSTTISFGSAPGTNMVTATVTGQTAIVAGSSAEAFIMGEASASHNAYEHAFVPIRLTCGSVVAGTGFTITAVSELRLTGTFNVRWVWA